MRVFILRIFFVWWLLHLSSGCSPSTNAINTAEEIAQKKEQGLYGKLIVNDEICDFSGRKWDRSDLDFFLIKNVVFKYNGKVWIIGSLDTRDGSVKDLQLIEKRPDGSDAVSIRAEKAVWLDGKWWFMNSVTQSYRGNGEHDGDSKLVLSKDMGTLDVTPFGLILEMRPERAKQGDGLAAYEMGCIFCFGGYGIIRQDYEEAAKYFWRAQKMADRNMAARARRDYAGTCMDLAHRYLDGVMVPRDAKEAYAWALLAAEAGAAEEITLKKDLLQKLAPKIIAAGEKRAVEILDWLNKSPYKKVKPPRGRFK